MQTGIVTSQNETSIAPQRLGARRSSFTFWLLLNGPAIITVLASSTFAVLAWVLTFTPAQSFQIILALLALIGTSLLTEKLIESRALRDRLQDIDHRLERVLAAQIPDPNTFDRLIQSRRDLPPLEERLLGATRIAISGGSLFRLVNEYQSLFEQLAQSGCQLRFIMTDPNSHAAEYLSVAVSYESSNVDTYRAHMRYTLAALSDFGRRFPQNCHVKLCSLALPFSLLRVDRDLGQSIQVELYPLSVPARDRPILLFEERTDPRLFSFFSTQFETLWNNQFTLTYDPRRVIFQPELTQGDLQ
jgi:hypothetical protein